MSHERAEPMLPARDLDETRAFYQKLGFTAWFGPDSRWTYEIVSRGNLVVHFFPEPTLKPADNRSGCYWRVEDADALYQQCVALGLPAQGTPSVSALCDQEWGMREFTLIDPSGNSLRIGHEIGGEVSLEDLVATIARMEARLSAVNTPEGQRAWFAYRALVPRFELDLGESPRDVALAKASALMVVQGLVDAEE